eukprot:160199_1
MLVWLQLVLHFWCMTLKSLAKGNKYGWCSILLVFFNLSNATTKYATFDGRATQCDQGTQQNECKIHQSHGVMKVVRNDVGFYSVFWQELFDNNNYAIFINSNIKLGTFGFAQIGGNNIDGNAYYGIDEAFAQIDCRKLGISTSERKDSNYISIVATTSLFGLELAVFNGKTMDNYYGIDTINPSTSAKYTVTFTESFSDRNYFIGLSSNLWGTYGAVAGIYGNNIVGNNYFGIDTTHFKIQTRKLWDRSVTIKTDYLCAIFGYPNIEIMGNYNVKWVTFNGKNINQVFNHFGVSHINVTDSTAKTYTIHWSQSFISNNYAVFGASNHRGTQQSQIAVSGLVNAAFVEIQTMNLENKLLTGKSDYISIIAIEYVPTQNPTFDPTFEPTFSPSLTPSTSPTITPTITPTFSPTACHDGNRFTNDGYEESINNILSQLTFEHLITNNNKIIIASRGSFLDREISFQYDDKQELRCKSVGSCQHATIRFSNNEYCNLLCNNYLSCYGAIINITKCGNSEIICDGDNACKKLTVNINSNSDNNLIIKCGSSSSCLNMEIRIKGRVKSQIKCIEVNACNNMIIDIDPANYKNVELNMLSYSSNIKYANGFGYEERNGSAQYITCNTKYHYIKWDNIHTNGVQSLEQKILDEYQNSLFPCDGITVECFHDNNSNITSSCDMRHTVDISSFYITNPVTGALCYWVPVSDVIDISCNGQCVTSPTENPTSAPSNAPSMQTTNPTQNPTKNPTIDPTNDPTKYPTYNPTLNPTFDPTVDPTGDPTTNEPTNEP